MATTHKRIPITRRRSVLLALYGALQQFQRGEFKDRNIAVGTLPTDLSAVYLAVETALENA